MIKTDYINFILFAELIGFVSPFVEWASKAYNGGELLDFQEDILKTESMVLVNKIHAQYTKDQIHEWWGVYEAIRVKPSKEDLPF